MIVLIPYINLLNLSWIIKCQCLRNMEPLKGPNIKVVHVSTVVFSGIGWFVFFTVCIIRKMSVFPTASPKVRQNNSNHTIIAVPCENVSSARA